MQVNGLIIKENQKVRFIDEEKNIYYCTVDEIFKKSLKAKIIEIISKIEM